MALSSLFMDSTKSVAKGSELPLQSPSATSITGSSLALMRQIRSWFGGISNESSLPAMSTGKSSTKSGLCCHFSATSHLPPVFWPACVFSSVSLAASRRWRLGGVRAPARVASMASSASGRRDAVAAISLTARFRHSANLVLQHEPPPHQLPIC